MVNITEEMVGFGLIWTEKIVVMMKVVTISELKQLEVFDKQAVIVAIIEKEKKWKWCLSEILHEIKTTIEFLFL